LSGSRRTSRESAETDCPHHRATGIAIGKLLSDELVAHLGKTPFKGTDERVFVNPRTGHPFDDARYKAIFTLAIGKAGIEGVVRPSHDLRHSSITNSAAAGTKSEALM
jgi:hypothetical protein